MSKSRIGTAYTSKTIQKILRKYIAEDQRKIEKRTQLATRIKIALEAKGLTHKDLAARISKRPSEIKRLINAKQDFSAEMLLRIQTELGIKLVEDKIS
jgi:ribosome-binding protein aMBF1 (putative translation factor)